MHYSIIYPKITHVDTFTVEGTYDEYIEGYNKNCVNENIRKGTFKIIIDKKDIHTILNEYRLFIYCNDQKYIKHVSDLTFYKYFIKVFENIDYRYISNFVFHYYNEHGIKGVLDLTYTEEENQEFESKMKDINLIIKS